jgi:alpha-D-ribose 1-methylphosphonate 5-triphosphate synthase subunit PhnL
MYHLEIRHLEKAFTLHLLKEKEIPALKDVSFEVIRGEFLGIVGRSGSGKSSLLKCIYRTYLPSGGSMLYEDSQGETLDLAGAATDEILRLRTNEIGYVSQFLRPIPRVTALNLVAEPLLSRGVNREEARVEAAALLASLHLSEELWDSYPVFFSGGEQQRVNLARAVISHPALLILDEPTASLDAVSQEAVIRILQQAKSSGTTVLGVFHDTNVLNKLADRMLVLNHGVVESINKSVNA